MVKIIFRCLSAAAILATLTVAAWPLLWAMWWPHLDYFPGLFGVRGFSPPVLTNVETSWYYIISCTAFTLWTLGMTVGLCWSIRRRNRAVSVLFLSCLLTHVIFGGYCAVLQFTGDWYKIFYESGIETLPPKSLEFNYAFWLTGSWIIGITSLLFARRRWPVRNLLILTFAAAVVVLVVSLSATVYLTITNYALNGGPGIWICLYFGTYSAAMHAAVAASSSAFAMTFVIWKAAAARQGCEPIVATDL